MGKLDILIVRDLSIFLTLLNDRFYGKMFTRVFPKNFTDTVTGIFDPTPIHLSES